MGSNRRGWSRDVLRGLTVIEVLVAIVILAFVALVIVGAVSVMVRLNVESSQEIDTSRVVRTVAEKARARWQDAEFWREGDANAEFSGYPEIVESGCTVAVIQPTDAGIAGAVVRVLSISCPLTGRPGEFEVFQVEFGEP